MYACPRALMCPGVPAAQNERAGVVRDGEMVAVTAAIATIYELS